MLFLSHAEGQTRMRVVRLLWDHETVVTVIGRSEILHKFFNALLRLKDENVELRSELLSYLDSEAAALELKRSEAS